MAWWLLGSFQPHPWQHYTLGGRAAFNCLSVCTHTFKAHLNIKCQNGSRCDKPCFSHFPNKLSLDVSCDSICDFSWWIHPVDVFYLYFPKDYRCEVAEEMETLALGSLFQQNSSWSVVPHSLFRQCAQVFDLEHVCCTVSPSCICGQSCAWVISAHVSVQV